MNKLSKAQRDQLMGIVVGTIALMAALWYFGVLAKQAELVATRKKSADMMQTLQDADRKMGKAVEIDAMLNTSTEHLHTLEAGLAPDRDAYAWLINTMNNFIASHKGISIDSPSQPEITDEGLIPRFPYRWATFHLKGTGYYHDLGKFFADFENNFPYFRIQNPVLTANAGPGMEPEKLSVSFDLVTPVASSPP